MSVPYSVPHLQRTRASAIVVRIPVRSTVVWIRDRLLLRMSDRACMRGLRVTSKNLPPTLASVLGRNSGVRSSSRNLSSEMSSKCDGRQQVVQAQPLWQVAGQEAYHLNKGLGRTCKPLNRKAALMWSGAIALLGILKQ